MRRIGSPNYSKLAFKLTHRSLPERGVQSTAIDNGRMEQDGRHGRGKTQMETAKIQGQSPERLAEKLRGIVAFLPSFQAPGFKFGRWTKPPSDQPGVHMLPYFSLSEVAGSFEQMAYELGWVMRDLNWGTWKQTPEAGGMMLRSWP
jgi:Family of unknown function (DUF6508)